MVQPPNRQPAAHWTLEGISGFAASALMTGTANQAVEVVVTVVHVFNAPFIQYLGFKQSLLVRSG